jgi:aspartate aminotransferase-like enzyme
MTSRKMSVESSCRKYLVALAFKLSTYCVFKEKSKFGATFGDVLEAIKISKHDTKPEWGHILQTNTFEQADENGDTGSDQRR